MDVEDADRDEDEERDQFCHRDDSDRAGSRAHAADVDRGESAVDEEEKGDVAPGPGERREQRDDGAGKKVNDRRDAEDGGGVIKKPGDKSDIAAEGDLGVGVEAAGERDATAGQREAGDEERHRDCANDEGEGSGRAELFRHIGGGA